MGNVFGKARHKVPREKLLVIHPQTGIYQQTRNNTYKIHYHMDNHKKLIVVYGAIDTPHQKVFI